MRSSSFSRQGFTLMEMLVAVAIMSFMLLMMAQMTGLAEQAWRMEQNRIDNFTKARAMVDMITDDLQRAVFRGDLPVFGTGGPASAPTVTSSGLYYFTGTSFTTAFYTRLPGVPGASASSVRDVSLVSYALNSVNQGVDKIVLQRSDLAVPWTSNQNLSFQGDIAALLPNAVPREVAPGVVGFRLAFRRADGTMVDPSQSASYTGYNAANPVVAVDVGVAVIGKQSLVLLSAAQITSIQTKLATAAVGNGIKASWDQGTLTSAFYSSYPKSFGDGLKTFERWVACPAF
jgi:prepilin-type N-terminal cleavage/methylation domain-containing protein